LGMRDSVLQFVSFNVLPPLAELPPLCTLARTVKILLLCTL
jgi:hypothetical protein